jgi:RNA polymerase sigma-70 factor (ECF subfamily)
MVVGEPVIRATLRPFSRMVDTEAIVQESLLRTWQVAPRISGDGLPNILLRVAVRIARNLAIAERRRAARVSDAGGTTPAAALLAPGDEAALIDRAAAQLPPMPDPQLRRAVEDCRNELPDRPRAALTARLTSGGLESDEVLAARLQMALNTFLQNVVRARRAVSECLRARGIDVEMSS